MADYLFELIHCLAETKLIAEASCSDDEDNAPESPRPSSAEPLGTYFLERWCDREGGAGPSEPEEAGRVAANDSEADISSSSLDEGVWANCGFPLAEQAPNVCACSSEKKQAELKASTSTKLPLVLKWGGKNVENTCTVDGPLCVIWARLQQEGVEGHQLNFLGTTEAELKLKTCLQKLLKGKLSLAKQEWADYLRSEPRFLHSVHYKEEKNLTDLYGCTWTRFLGPLSSTFALAKVRFCPHCGVQEEKPLLWSNMTFKYIDELNWKARRAPPTRCRECKTKDGRQERLRFRYPAPWLLPVHCAENFERVNDLSRLPCLIRVGGWEFVLAGVTLYRNHHFTALIRFRGDWLHYDGAKRARWRIQPMDDVPSYAGFTPEFALYLRARL